MTLLNIPPTERFQRDKYYLNFYCIDGARAVYIFHTFKDEDTIQFRLTINDSGIALAQYKDVTCEAGMQDDASAEARTDLYYELSEVEYQLIMVGGQI